MRIDENQYRYLMKESTQLNAGALVGMAVFKFKGIMASLDSFIETLDEKIEGSDRDTKKALRNILASIDRQSMEIQSAAEQAVAAIKKLV